MFKTTSYMCSLLLNASNGASSLCVRCAGAVVWSEHGTGRVRRLRADGSVDTLRSFAPPLYDLRLVAAAARTGTQRARFRPRDLSRTYET